MQPSFSPSINLIRDAEHDFRYIPTLNAKRIYDQILSDFKTGIHAFNIIGSYGTGKSSFLLALMRTLNGHQPYFGTPNGQFRDANEFEFMSFVGAYSSVVNAFGLYFSVLTEQEVLTALDKYYKQLAQKNICLVIIVDEFGKFLEYAAQVNPERELYFIQLLAEYVNDPAKNILFVTTLHQGFFSYAQGLTQNQQEEWEKVKGRLKELTFNEPVEQLLELAASHLEKNDAVVPHKNLQTLVDLVESSALFPYRGKLSMELAQHLLPLDLISASVITQALQRYGQNERSLFTFLNSTEFLEVDNYNDENFYYDLVNAYDYLIYNFYSFLSSVKNPHYVQWGAIRTAIERAEAVIEERHGDAIALIKIIGLLNIFSPAGARINSSFLLNYLELVLNIKNPESVLNALENFKILRYVRFKDSFVLFDGTDLNIELAILEATNQIDSIQNIVPYINKYFDFPLLLAKAVTYKFGIPRFFEFSLSETMAISEPEGITDGFINLIFSENMGIEQLIDLSASCPPTTIFCLFQQTRQIRNILFEIEKINYVLDVHKDDLVAKRELEKLREYQREKLNRYTLDVLYTNDGSVTWVHQGETLNVTNISKFNELLSKICQEAYHEIPIFRNELINRHKLSSSINSARSNYFKALIERWQLADFGYNTEKFPPDRTIYMTLLQQTGIHRKRDDGYILAEPTSPSFQPLWKIGIDFLNSAKQTPRHLSDLHSALLARPFKLKAGFVEFWLPTFLFVNRENFALYYDGLFVASLESETLELVRKEPQKFQIKTFSVDGIRLEFFNRCRALLKMKASGSISSENFLQTVSPLIIFYSTLPIYTQNTKQLEQSTIRLRQVISMAKDPEKTFFEDFPAALGFPDISNQEILDEQQLEAYVTQLQTSIRELQSAFDSLVDRIESSLLDHFGLTGIPFPDYKDDISKRYTGLLAHMLAPKLKTLHMRLNSPLEERTAWLESIVQALLGKNIRSMKDEDEFIVYTKLQEAIQALDNLCELDELQVDLEKEIPAISVQITSSNQGSKKVINRLSRNKEEDVRLLMEKVRIQLGDDSAVNFAALTNLLQEVINNE